MIQSIVFIFGLLIGSFLGVVISRLPINETFVTGRSRCDSCKHVLSPLDLIPVFSYLFFKGHCRYCKVKLPIRYLILELLTGLLFMLNYIVFGFSYQFIISTLLTIFLIIIAYIDIDTMIIYDRFHILIAGIAIIEIILLKSNILNHIIGTLIISIPFLILAMISNGLGGGDIKLMAAAGFLLGVNKIFVAFIISSLIGGIYAIYVLINKKAKGKDAIPFGPFLCIGIYLGYLIGNPLLNWYLSLFM